MLRTDLQGPMHQAFCRLRGIGLAWWPASALLLLSGASAGSTGKVWEVQPGQDYRQLLPRLQPGDELVLHEGVYEGPAVVAVSGVPGKPITIRGYGQGQQRPILLWEGRGHNLWRIQGDHLVVRGLEFRPTHGYSIRIGGPGKGGKGITIEECIFRNCGGGSISANHGGVAYEEIRIRRNQFLGAKATPLYIGNHEGSSPVTGFVFERNLVDASQITAGGIVGYGIQLKLNVRGGVIRNNFLTGSKGPGIMVYGATGGTRSDANLVEGNIVVGARHSAGIVVGGGPSVMRDNLVLACPAGGISLQDYAGRGILDGIDLSGNTAAYNDSFGISFGGLRRTARNVRVARNLVLSRPGVAGYRLPADPPSWWSFPGRPGSPVFGNKSTVGAVPEVVARLVGFVPQKERLEPVWPHLAGGPLDEQQLTRLLAQLLQPDGSLAPP